MEKFKLILFLITLFGLNLDAQMIADTWDYPVKPGSEEWRQLKTHKTKVDVCQIPDSILSDLSTNDLINICLSYPLLIDIIAFNNIQDGMNNLKSNFNGFRELLNRNESGELLMDNYSKFNPLEFDENWSEKRIGAHIFNSILFELFLSQIEIINKLEVNDKKNLVRVLLDRQKAISNRKDIFGSFSHMSLIFTISRIVYSEDISNVTNQKSEKTKINKFVENGTFHDKVLIPEILLIGNKYIK